MRLSWECPRSVWSALVDRSPEATFFHTPEWADAAAAHGLGQPRVLLAQWPDGRQALCVLAIRPVWGGLVRAARSGTAGGYGGLVANGPLSDAERRGVYQALWRRFGECGGASNPFAAPPPMGAGFQLTAAPPTQVIRLAPLPELRSRYNRERRRAVERYQASDVGLRLIHRPSIEDWHAFMRLYEQEVAIWHGLGRPLSAAHEAGWFLALQHHAGRRLRMVAATVAGELAGMLVYAFQAHHVSELYMAWDRRFAEHRVSTALKEACLAESQSRGMAVVDFMPSGALTGVERFKASFGAAPLPVWEYYHPSWSGRGLRLLRPAHTA